MLVGAYIYNHLSLDELNLLLCQLDNQTSNTTVWLAADFKAPSIGWKTMSLKSNHIYVQTNNSLLGTTTDHGLTQLITDSTRYDNTLNIFTDHPSQIAGNSILPGMNDHDNVTTADIKTKLTDHSPRRFLLYHKTDWMQSEKTFIFLQLIFLN